MSCDHVTNWCIVFNWQTSWYKEVSFFSWYLINLLLCWKKGKWSVTSWRWKNRNVMMRNYRGRSCVPLLLQFLWGTLPQKIHRRWMTSLVKCPVMMWQTVTLWVIGRHLGTKRQISFLDTWSIYSCVERKVSSV